jgi:hypothetical protein
MVQAILAGVGDGTSPGTNSTEIKVHDRATTDSGKLLLGTREVLVAHGPSSRLSKPGNLEAMACRA